MYSLIKSLMMPLGVSGREAPIREVIEGKIKPYVDDVRTDPMGNLIAHKAPTAKNPNGKKLMFTAHTDEIGFYVTGVNDEGFVRFSAAGGIRYEWTVPSRVIFDTGLIGILIGDDSASSFNADNCWVDIGAKSKKEAERKVKVGDTFTVEPTISKLGTSWLTGRPFDDRIGCAILVEAAMRAKTSPYDIYYVFTSQEEIGCRGSRVAAYEIMPDVAVAVDITKTGDTPGALKMGTRLGGGAAIKVKDPSVICDPHLVDTMVSICKSEKIPYQLEILTMGGTDTSELQSAGAGRPAGCISIPTRYAHTPLETIDTGDVEACVRLTTALIEGR
ncbi:MAG: M20/M25/M40 family metallo-hydrolase [Firmicutes bacterium]|nr:M20/M25/M40 family metallo-hydrolase [Bacillota bacterium]